MTPAHTAPRIEQTDFAGQRAWIKRPEAARSSKFALVHGLLRRFLPTVLQPTTATGGMPSLLEEAARLKAFGAASVRVPDVLDITDSYIVLSDCGPQLRQIVHDTRDQADKTKLLQLAVTNMAQLHAKHLTHGRPHLKDMTLLNDQIYLLDLEENPLAVMDLGFAQARDVWLLLASCTEHCATPYDDLAALLTVYQNQSDHDIRPQMRVLGRQLRFIRRFIALVGAQNASRDVTGAYWATKVFETL